MSADDDEANDGWYYIDDDGNEQGPYPEDSIRQWFRDDYFDRDTRVRHVDDEAFVRIVDSGTFKSLVEPPGGKKDEQDDDDERSKDGPPLAPLKLDGVDVPPPPGWRGEPIVSDAEAVRYATEQLAAMLAAAEAQQQQLASADATQKQWTDGEFEYWSTLAAQNVATPLALPQTIWLKLERERRERQRIAGMTEKFIKAHQIKGLKRKKYSWSS